MKAKKTTQCGDWHLGWGYGGHDKIGYLSIEIHPDCPINFVWNGLSQGRHGQKWNYGAYARFMVTDRGLRLTEQKGSCPVYSQIVKAASELLKIHGLPELQEPVEVY